MKKISITIITLFSLFFIFGMFLKENTILAESDDEYTRYDMKIDYLYDSGDYEWDGDYYYYPGGIKAATPSKSRLINTEVANQLFDVYYNYLKYNDPNLYGISGKIHNPKYWDNWGYVNIKLLVDSKKGDFLALNFEHYDYGVNKDIFTLRIYKNDLNYIYGVEKYSINNHFEDSVFRFGLNNPPYTDNDKLPFAPSWAPVKVDFNYTDTNLDINLATGEKIRKIMAPNTDMTIFETIEAYYVNENNTPQIIINNGDKLYLKDIITSPDKEKPAFVPHSVWDLNSGVITTISAYQTYIYLKQNPSGVMMAYVYIDEYIIDSLLTAEIEFTARQKNGFPESLILGKYTEWKRENKVLANDKFFKYKNLTSSWQDLIPVWNIVSGIKKLTTEYEMPSITPVNFFNMRPEHNITKNELKEMYQKNLGSSFDEFKDSDKYKVWALSFKQGKDWFGTQTEIYNNASDSTDPNNFSIIKLTYETNGRLYESDGSYMDNIIEVENKIDGNNPNKDNDISNKLDIKGIILIAMLGLIFISAMQSKAFASPQKAIRFIIGTVIIIGLLYLVYYLYINQIIILSVLRL